VEADWSCCLGGVSEHHRSLIGLDKTTDGVQQGSLARARGANEGEHLATVDVNGVDSQDALATTVAPVRVLAGRGRCRRWSGSALR